MTTILPQPIDYDKILEPSDTVKRVRDMVIAPENMPDEEPTAEDRREAGRRLPGNPDDTPNMEIRICR